MADDRTIRVRLLAEIGSYMDGMRRAGGVTKQFGKDLSGHGAAARADIEKVGRSAMLMAGGVAVAAGLAVKAAIDWETAWTGVTKTVDGTGAEMQRLEDGLRGLARTLPASHKEIAAVAEAAGQLGVARDDIVGFTKTMVDLGETTNLTAEDAATSIAQIMNVMGTAASEVDNFGAALVDLGNNGASTESDILDMTKRLAGAGSVIGATEQGVLALSNTMSSLGIQAELGGGAMSRTLYKVFVAVKEGGDKLEGFARVSGMSAKEFAAAWEADPIRAMDAFITGLSKVNESGGNVITTLKELGIKGTQDLQVLTRMMGDVGQLGRDIDLSNKAWEEATALAVEAGKRYGTTASQMKVLRNQVVDTGIEMGDKLLPVVLSVTDALTSLITGFSGLPGPAKTVIGVFTGLLAIGLGIVGMVALLGPQIAQLTASLMKMGAAGQFVAANLGVLAAGFAVVTAALGAYLYMQGVKAREEAQSESRTKSFAEAIAEAGDAVAGTANQLVQMVSSNAEFARFLDRTKIRIDDIAEAMQGTDRQWDSFVNGMKRTAEAAGIGGDDIGRAVIALNAFREEALQGKGDAEALARVLEETGVVGEEGMAKVANAAGVTEESIKELEASIESLMGSLYGVEAAQDAWQSQLNALDDVLKAAVTEGLSLNDVLTSQSDAAISVREHMRGMVQSGADLIQTWIEQGVTGDDLRNRVATLTDAFYQQGRDLGLTDEAARHYAESLLEIPTNVDTDIVVDDNGSTFTIKAIKDGLDGLHDKTIRVTTIESAVRQGYTSPVNQNTPRRNPDSRMGNVFSFASGGITNAHIARDGSILRYAEKATGGEAFIPRNGDAARSMGILQTAAGWYGASVSMGPAPVGGGGAAGGGMSVTVVVNNPLGNGKEIAQTVAKELRTNPGFAATVRQRVSQ